MWIDIFSVDYLKEIGEVLGLSDGEVLYKIGQEIIKGSCGFNDNYARVNLRTENEIISSDENKRKSFSYNSFFVKIGRRDGFCCKKCGSHKGDLVIDHIKPVSKEGSNDLNNLQLLCSSCNRIKSNK